MRFEKTPAFDADWRRLSADERVMFRRSAREFSHACDRHVEDRRIAWPAALRIKKVEGAAGIFEMTWSFSGPDGRATWEWVSVEVGEQDGAGAPRVVRYPAIRWRRVGTHRIFSDP